MKKRIIITLLVLAVFACGFIPVTKSEKFKIDANYTNVYHQVISPESWLKWQHDLTERPNAAEVKVDSNKTGFRVSTSSVMFDLQDMGLGNFAVIKTRDRKIYNFQCILTPENITNKTLAVVVCKTNVFGWISGLIAKNDDQSVITGLKNYMEDPALYYGFMIKKEITPQKLIAVKTGTFLNAALFRNGDTMLDQLNNFVSKNNLEIVAHLQLQYVATQKDSTQIMLGFPVNKMAASANGVTYMTMPKSKILVGYFSGLYKNKDKLYKAIRLYMNDNYIRPMIQPFERFDTNNLPANDSVIVNMQLVVPYM